MEIDSDIGENMKTKERLASLTILSVKKLMDVARVGKERLQPMWGYQVSL